jgi:uncharacterized repeat protein (TIGR01451 family)
MKIIKKLKKLFGQLKAILYTILVPLLVISCCIQMFFTLKVFAAASLQISTSVISTGQAPFDPNDLPGNDSSATNNIVRINDNILYKYDVTAVGGDVTNVSITHPSPNLSLYFGVNTLPHNVCQTGSSFSYAMTCKLGTITSGSVVSVQLYARANAANVPVLSNGYIYNSVPTVSGTGVSSVISDLPSLIPVLSTRPETDIQFSGGQTQDIYLGPSGENGIIIPLNPFIYQYEYESLQIPTFSFTLDLTQATPNTRLVTWGSYANKCYSSLATIPLQCTQSSPGSNISVSTTATSGVTLGNVFWSGIIAVWVPETDLTPAPYNGSRTVTFKETGFAPISVTGQVNYGTTTYPSSSRSIVATTYASTSSSLSFLYSSAGTLTGTSVAKSLRNEKVKANHSFGISSSAISLQNFVQCLKLDTTAFTFSLESASEIPKYTGSSPNNTGLIVEYGTGGYTSLTDQKNKTCENSDSPDGWFTNYNLVPGGKTAITKIRMTSTNPLDINSGYASAQTIIKTNTYLNNNPANGLVPAGTTGDIYLSYKYSNSSTTGWINTNSSSNRIEVWDVRTESIQQKYNSTSYTSSSLANLSFTAGDTITYTSKVTLNSGNFPSGNTVTVNMVQIADIRLEFQSINYPSLTLVSTTCTATQCKRVWSMPLVSANPPTTIEVPVTYRVAVNTPNGTTGQAVGTSWEINGKRDANSPQIVSITGSNIYLSTSILNNNSFALDISQDKSRLTLSDNVTYTLSYSNLQTSVLSNTKMINVLPYSGDTNRSPTTNFGGTTTLSSVSVTNGEVIEYTSTPSASINSDPCHISNIGVGLTSDVACTSLVGGSSGSGSTVWCGSFSGGTCPSSLSDVKAIRIIASNVPATTTRTFGVVVNYSGGTSNQVVSNDFKARASTLGVLADSRDISATFGYVDIEVTLSTNATSVFVTDNVSYTISVSNVGISNASGVVLAHTLPSSLQFVSSSMVGGSYNSSTGVWTIGSLNSGASASTLTIIAKVLTSGSISSKAEITATTEFDIDSTPNNNVSTEDDQKTYTFNGVNASSDLSLRIQTQGGGDTNPSTIGQVNSKSNQLYTFTVTNNSSDRSKGVVVSVAFDPLKSSPILASGANYTSSSDWNCTYSNSLLTCTYIPVQLNGSSNSSFGVNVGVL